MKVSQRVVRLLEHDGFKRTRQLGKQKQNKMEKQTKAYPNPYFFFPIWIVNVDSHGSCMF